MSETPNQPQVRPARAAPDAMTFGPWRATAPLGLGLDAAVWHADGPAPATVALKVPRRPDAIEALRREFDLLRRLAHPHLPWAEAADPQGAWFAYRQAAGDPIHLWAPQRPLHEALAAAVELAGALASLHAAGFLHGDLKPMHVRVDEQGHPKLIDLGSASPITTGAAVRDAPRASAAKLTPGFAAPELLAGGAPSVASDVYALCATLYAGLTGKMPHDLAHPAALLHHVAHVVAVPAGAWRADLAVPFGERAVEDVLAEGLHREPSRRPTVDAITRDLGALWDHARDRAAGLSHEVSGAAPIVGMPRARLALRRVIASALGRSPGAVAGPRVLFFAGPPGSGRSTLARDAARVAESEGFVRDGEASSSQERGAIVLGPWAAPALRARANAQMEQPRPAIVITWGDCPPAALEAWGEDATVILPEPWGRPLVEQLGAACGLDPEASAGMWRLTTGHPGRVVWGLRRAARERGRESPLAAGRHRDVGLVEEHLRHHHGASPVLSLARAAQLAPGALMDHLELLEAEGVIAFGPGAQTVRWIEPGEG
jgi:hypothetical protein